MEQIIPEAEVVKRDDCCIPERCQLDLWAKVIIAKSVLEDEPIFGSYDEYGEPDPAQIVVDDLAPDETVECIYDFKITFDQDDVIENFVCTSKVILTIPFTGYFWIKTNLGFKCVKVDFVYTQTIPLSEFIKLDGTPLTPEEFKKNVDQSKAVVCDYAIDFINILPKVGTEQIIEIIITATVVDKLGEFKDVIVYGYVESFCDD